MRARRGPSHKGCDARRPRKKPKCEKKTQAKLEGRGAEICGNSSTVTLSKEPVKASPAGNWGVASLPSSEVMLQSEGKGVPKVNEDMQEDRPDLCTEATAMPGANSCFPKADGKTPFQPRAQDVEEEEEEGEEVSCEAEFSDNSEMEPEELQDHVAEFDNSAFLNEDSNQPLPVDCFFGSIAFMQDLPAAPLARAPASRREFRKLHFIAKDDEDDDEEEEVI